MPKTTNEQAAALENLRARMAAKRAPKAATKLGPTASGAYNCAYYRADGQRIIITVPGRH